MDLSRNDEEEDSFKKHTQYDSFLKSLLWVMLTFNQKNSKIQFCEIQAASFGKCQAELSKTKQNKTKQKNK